MNAPDRVRELEAEVSALRAERAGLLADRADLHRVLSRIGHRTARVVRAVTVPGKVPAYHRRQVAELVTAWPELAGAVAYLVAESSSAHLLPHDMRRFLK